MKFSKKSATLDALACINMYCNIERKIMKNQAGSPGFGIQGKISVNMCFMCYALAIVYFLCFRIRMQLISVRGQSLQGNERITSPNSPTHESCEEFPFYYLSTPQMKIVQQLFGMRKSNLHTSKREGFIQILNQNILKNIKICYKYLYKYLETKFKIYYKNYIKID